MLQCLSKSTQHAKIPILNEYSVKFVPELLPYSVCTVCYLILPPAYHNSQLPDLPHYISNHVATNVEPLEPTKPNGLTWPEKILSITINL